MSVKPYDTKAGQRWLFVIDLPKHPDGKRNQLFQRGYKTETEARTAEAAARKTHGEQRLIADGTVAAELRAWFEERAVDLKPTTVGGYRTKFETYVIPHIGARRLRSLDASTINSLYLTLLAMGGRDGKPMAPASVLSVHKTLMAALRDLGVDLKVRVPRGGNKTGRHGVWDDTQCVAFLRHTQQDRLYAAWALAIVCGLRRGELAGLRWSHLNLDVGLLSIAWQRTTVDGGKGSVVEQDPKGADRTIPLGAALVAVLLAHKAAQDAERAAAEAAGKTYAAGDYVFCSNRGRPYYPGHFSRTFGKRAGEAGLPHIALHDARHSSFTVSSAVAGVDIKTLQGRSGHADPDTLTRVYLHALPAAARAAASAIEGVLLPPHAA